MLVLYRLRVCLAALVLAASASCAGDGESLALVGEQRVEIAAFQKYVDEATGDAWQGVNALVSSRLLDQYLDRQVILEAANHRELSLISEGSNLGPMEVQWLLDELCGPAPAPGSVEVEEEVANRLERTHPAQAHVRQVLVDSHEEALVAQERLAADEDFLLVSRELSRAPNAAEGGELGFIDHGSLPPEFDDVIFALEAGEFSEPVPGPSGYHVFQVLQVIPSGPPDRAEVETVVREEFSRQRAREHTGVCVQNLVSEIGIEVYGKNLWFPYTGRYSEGQSNA